MWFRKNRDRTEDNPGLSAGSNRLTDEAAGWIAKGIISFQMGVARKLASWEKKCNRAQKKIALFLFCGIVSCYLFFSLRDALSEKPGQAKGTDREIGTMSVPPLPTPLPPHNKGDTTVKPVLPLHRNK